MAGKSDTKKWKLTIRGNMNKRAATLREKELQKIKKEIEKINRDGLTMQKVCRRSIHPYFLHNPFFVLDCRIVKYFYENSLTLFEFLRDNKNAILNFSSPFAASFYAKGIGLRTYIIVEK